jgi:single-stranded-DNA-specific exonuclease
MEIANLPTTHWKLSEDNKEIENLFVKEFGVTPILSKVLTSRHILTQEDAQKFLSPSLNDLHNPFLMLDMQKGIHRIIKAIYSHEKIGIYGDYDADGITSVVVLHKFLNDIDHPAEYYIPDRILEGYGLNKNAIDKLHADGVRLLVTVDCGVSDHRQISYAESLGMDTIILDHHEVPNIIPDAIAVIDQNRIECRFPFKHLAAVGIVFNFLIALRGALRDEGFWSDKKYPNLRDYLDLVALGTIGDISPLVDENRIFAKIGLDLITEGKRVGIKALKEVCGIENEVIDSGKASFCLIPRINAAGRLASAGEAVKLLLTDDIYEARELANQLEIYNRKRQTMEKAILAELLYEIENSINLKDVGALVFASEKWHPGVIGIVASRLVDRYARPAILISLKDGVGKGSGRSIADFNIYQGLKQCDSLLLSYGGHRYAAGISIREDDITEFRTLLEQIVRKDADISNFMSHTMIDAQCDLHDINHELMTQIKMLAPFGSRNPEPVFCVRNIRITSQSIVGNNHLSMRVTGNGLSYNSIWFSNGKFFNSLSDTNMLDIAFTPQISHWKGSSDIQLKLKDMAFSAH